MEFKRVEQRTRKVEEKKLTSAWTVVLPGSINIYWNKS